MVLTKKQEEGLKIAIERYKNKEPYTCISGYAGTGKSTLVKFIVAALDLEDKDVCYITYTGKAALVLRNKGCHEAMTAHKLLYQSFPRADGSFYHKPRRPIYPYKIIIVDEISMLPDDIWQLLLSHHIHVIALGDPGQLPPIGKDNGVLQHPHIFLDEIMRQAQESEIIRLTMDIREGKPLQLFDGNEVKVISAKDVVSGMYTWADQIIVAKNETRRKTNSLMRQYLHGVETNDPIEGDRVICLKNDWDNPNEVGDVLVNGTIGTIHNLHTFENNYWLKPRFSANFLPDYVSQEEIDRFKDKVYFNSLNIDYKLLKEGVPVVNQKNFKTFPRQLKPREFDYGYCITCHKSQGSEYDKVLVFEEFLKNSDHTRWLYTAATRAKEKLVIVKA